MIQISITVSSEIVNKERKHHYGTINRVLQPEITRVKDLPIQPIEEKYDGFPFGGFEKPAVLGSQKGVTESLTVVNSVEECSRTISELGPCDGIDRREVAFLNDWMSPKVTEN